MVNYEGSGGFYVISYFIGYYKTIAGVALFQFFLLTALDINTITIMADVSISITRKGTE